MEPRESRVLGMRFTTQPHPSLLDLFGAGHATMPRLVLNSHPCGSVNQTHSRVSKELVYKEEESRLKLSLKNNRIEKFSREPAAYCGGSRSVTRKVYDLPSKVQTHPCCRCAAVSLGPCAQRLTSFPGTTVRLGYSAVPSPRQALLHQDHPLSSPRPP